MRHTVAEAFSLSGKRAGLQQLNKLFILTKDQNYTCENREKKVEVIHQGDLPVGKTWNRLHSTVCNLIWSHVVSFVKVCIMLIEFLVSRKKDKNVTDNKKYYENLGFAKKVEDNWKALHFINMLA